MSFSTRRAMIAAATAALVGCLPAAASASPTQLTGIADDNVLNETLTGAGPRSLGIDAILAQWKAAGVQDVRTFAQWDKLAPDAGSTKVPVGLNAKDPASYDFSLLDRKLDRIAAHGMTPTLVITGPGPVWGSSEPARIDGKTAPSPAMFGEFAIAVAKHVADRVQRYIVWNEPNVQTWLRPQYRCTSQNNCESYAPHLYRQLARAGYQAIHDNDPDATVAVGGTSSLGNKFATSTNTTTQPLRFLRAMACVNDKYQAVRTGYCKNFKPVTGDVLSYHPHSKEKSPGQRDPDPNNARMADLSRLTGVLDKLTAKGAIKIGGKASKMPLWLDEYAYETNPPDKGEGLVSPSAAATYSQWGWSVAARNSRVKMLTQYEWFDEPTGDVPGQFTLWQSGLFTIDGKPKPLSKVFSAPIFGWRTSKSASVWGQARAGNAKVTVTLLRKSGGNYKRYKTVKTNANGVFQVAVKRSAKDRFRFSYADPATGQVLTSAVTTLRRTS